MKRNRKAKILATLGPASSDKKIIEDLFVAGCDVFRLNFSHGDLETHRKNYDNIRSLEKKHNHASCILACLLYTSPSPRDRQKSRMPSSA